MSEVNDRLREIMKRHKLSIRETAELLGVSNDTVISWRRPPTIKSHRPMPANLLELLEFKTGERSLGDQ